MGYGGSNPGNYAVLVTEKNISDAEIWGSGCTNFEDWLNLIVLYDGVRMPMTDAVKSLNRARQAQGRCGADFGDWKIGPGDEHPYDLDITRFYNMRKAGTYTITVTKETASQYPEMSTTVKSNTITIVVR
ncbi:MAG: hypothetical protein WBW84_15935 [Acidobacteriaceae bacterium]